MKVLHVIPAVAPRYGGPSRAIFEMGRALRQQGIDVLVATTDADGAGHLAVETGAARTYEGVPTIFFPRQVAETFGYSRPLARWLAVHVREFAVAHIHAVFSHPCLAAARACRRHRVPYIVRPLGSLDPWSLRQKRWRKHVMWYGGIGRMLHGAAAVHYTTSEEQQLAEQALGLTNGFVTPLGVEVAEPWATSARSSVLPPGIADDPYLLVLSRLHPKKNVELLLDVFLTLTQRPEFTRWQLVVAGDGETGYVNMLKQRAVAGSGRVIFTGWLDGAERTALLRHAELLALTSRQENFGLCVVEALAHGVPVLISEQVNLAPEVSRARAGWVSPLNHTDLMRVLADALTDEAERRMRGQSGRAFVASNYSWATVAAKLARVYNSLTSDASAGVDNNLACPVGY
ncbi:MAG: glycosyltransferase [Pyrinomonadaceae bacterium]